MPRKGMALLVFIGMAGYAPLASGGEEAIIGEWVETSTGLADFGMVFAKDHTFQIVDLGRRHDGAWSFSGSTYSLTSPFLDTDQVGRIDEKGRLLVNWKATDGAEPNFIFERRPAAPTPAPAPAGELPDGEWRLAYISKSSMPSPLSAPFDTMTFKPSGKVLLKSTMASKEFERACEFRGNIISILLGSGGAPKLEFSYRWEEKGERLMLSVPSAAKGPFDTEWAFLKPVGFLASDLDGTWILGAGSGDEIEEIVFRQDGVLLRTVRSTGGKELRGIDPKKRDFYRLWPAPFGRGLTLVNYDPGTDTMSTQMFKYEKTAGGLAMTPIEVGKDGKQKIHDERKAVLKLK